ncbi:MAG: ATP-binding protein [Phycisphaeraceae bacterium]
MVTLGAVWFAVHVLTQELTVARARQADTDQIVRGVFELNLLTSEYIRHPNDRTREQWNQRRGSLSDLLQRLAYDDPERRQLLDAMRQRYEELVLAIERLSALHAEGEERDAATVREQEEQFITQLTTRSQASVSLASRLSVIHTAEVADLQAQAFRWFGSLLVLMAVVVGGSALLVARDIARALSRLRSEIEMVGGDRPQHEVTADRRDEIGQLAHAFNNMSRRLRRITVSRDELQREIEQRKQTEERLQATAAALTRSNTELEQFAYIASHDLQEPLRKVEGFGEMLTEHLGQALDAEARDYLRRMVSAIQRMRDLINGLLTYSRVTTKQRPFEPVDLNEIVRDVLSDLELRIQETAGRVQVDDLPAIVADPLQMRQLLQNLIGNGLKFHHADKPPRVRVTAERVAAESAQGDQDRCRIFVQDNGIGIDPKDVKQLFMPFRRLHGRSSRYAGTGIGLAVCRKIAERHGGTIRIDSTPGHGSTFVVTLPNQGTEPTPQEEDAP